MWIANEVNVITVIGTENLDVKAYYKQTNSEVNFVEISSDFVYKGDNVHELECSFDAGEYVIRVNDLTNGFIKYLKIEVGFAGIDRYSQNTNNKVSSILKKLNKKGF